MGTTGEKLQKILDTKLSIKNAIISKGIDISDTDTFASYPEKIASISGGGITIDGITNYTIYESPTIGDTWACTTNNKVLDMTSESFLNTFYDNYVGTNSDGYTVTKKELGKDESGTYSIHEYDFKPKNWNRMILLSGGMHAYELSACFGLAHFIKYIMENHDTHEGLKYIYENVRIKVVPIINPWGWNQNPKKYGNVNGININRNFDANGNWNQLPTSNDEWNQKGDSPFSENETRVMRNWLSSNVGAEFYIDTHTGLNCFGQADNCLYYLSDSSLKDKIETALGKLNNWIYDKYGTMGTSNSDHIWTSTPNCITDYAEKSILQIPAFTLEQNPENTKWGTSINNEGSDIQHYVTSIATYVMELLLKENESVDISKVLNMKQNIVELKKDKTNYIDLKDTTPIVPPPIVSASKVFSVDLSTINKGDTNITADGVTLDIIGTDWSKNDDGSISFGATSGIRYNNGLFDANNKSFTLVLDMAYSSSTGASKYIMLWGDFNSDTEGFGLFSSISNIYLKDFSNPISAQIVLGGTSLSKDIYIISYDGTTVTFRTKDTVLGTSKINIGIPKPNKVMFGNTNTLNKNPDGKLYSISLYSGVLSDDEIQAL